MKTAINNLIIKSLEENYLCYTELIKKGYNLQILLELLYSERNISLLTQIINDCNIRDLLKYDPDSDTFKLITGIRKFKLSDYEINRNYFVNNRHNLCKFLSILLKHNEEDCFIIINDLTTSDCKYFISYLIDIGENYEIIANKIYKSRKIDDDKYAFIEELFTPNNEPTAESKMTLDFSHIDLGETPNEIYNRLLGIALVDGSVVDMEDYISFLHEVNRFLTDNDKPKLIVVTSRPEFINYEDIEEIYHNSGVLVFFPNYDETYLTELELPYYIPLLQAGITGFLTKIKTSKLERIFKHLLYFKYYRVNESLDMVEVKDALISELFRRGLQEVFITILKEFNIYFTQLSMVQTTRIEQNIIKGKLIKLKNTNSCYYALGHTTYYELWKSNLLANPEEYEKLLKEHLPNFYKEGLLQKGKISLELIPNRK